MAWGTLELQPIPVMIDRINTGIGCSSNVPQAIRGDPAEGALKPVSVAQVQQDAESYRGQRVRWGGSIIAVRNLPDNTEIEVLSRPLDSDGEPRAEGASGHALGSIK